MSRRPPVKKKKVQVPERVESGTPVGQGMPRSSVTLTHTTTEVRHSGPLPHPKDLAAYDEILPGSAERIVQMAERQQLHRHSIESTDLRAGIKYAESAQNKAFALAVILIFVATGLALKGLIWIAGAIFTFVLVGLSATFLMSRRENQAAKGAAAVKPPAMPTAQSGG